MRSSSSHSSGAVVSSAPKIPMEQIDQYGSMNALTKLLGNSYRQNSTLRATLYADIDAYKAKKPNSDPYYYRKQYFQFLQELLDDPLAPKFTGDKEARKRDPESVATTMEEFLGSKGLRLFENALLEEVNSEEYMDGLVIASLTLYAGDKFSVKLIIIVAGPSASGKSYALKFILNEVADYIPKLPIDHYDGVHPLEGNLMLTVDGDICRSQSRVRGATVKVALERGFPSVRDLQNKCDVLEKAKQRVLDFALSPQNTAGVIIPETFSYYFFPAWGGQELLNRIAGLKDVRPIFCQVIHDDEDLFQRVVFNNAMFRAWQKNWDNELVINYALNDMSGLPSFKGYRKTGFTFGKLGSMNAEKELEKLCGDRFLGVKILSDQILVCCDDVSKQIWRVATAKDQEVVTISKRMFVAWEKTRVSSNGAIVPLLDFMKDPKNAVDVVIKENGVILLEKAEQQFQKELGGYRDHVTRVAGKQPQTDTRYLKMVEGLHNSLWQYLSIKHPTLEQHDEMAGKMGQYARNIQELLSKSQDDYWLDRDADFVGKIADALTAVFNAMKARRLEVVQRFDVKPIDVNAALRNKIAQRILSLVDIIGVEPKHLQALIAEVNKPTPLHEWVQYLMNVQQILTSNNFVNQKQALLKIHGGPLGIVIASKLHELSEDQIPIVQGILSSIFRLVEYDAAIAFRNVFATLIMMGNLKYVSDFLRTPWMTIFYNPYDAVYGEQPSNDATFLCKQVSAVDILTLSNYFMRYTRDIENEVLRVMIQTQKQTPLLQYRSLLESLYNKISTFLVRAGVTIYCNAEELHSLVRHMMKQVIECTEDHSISSQFAQNAGSMDVSRLNHVHQLMQSFKELKEVLEFHEFSREVTSKQDSVLGLSLFTAGPSFTATSSERMPSSTSSQDATQAQKKQPSSPNQSQ